MKRISNLLLNIFLSECYTLNYSLLQHQHSDLKIKISTLLEENKRLNKDLKESYSAKENEVLLLHDHADITKNLKQQIQKLLEEKECTTKLWQNSLRTIDFLEGELKILQAGTQGFVPKKEVVKVSSILGYSCLVTEYKKNIFVDIFNHVQLYFLVKTGLRRKTELYRKQTQCYSK